MTESSAPNDGTVYLFNSAYQLTYFENLYKILGLPNEVRLDMRYTENLNAPDKSTDFYYRNRECIICYIDRFSEGGYTYYPLRKGVIKSIKRVQARVFYNILLLDHCHSEKPTEFTKFIQDKCERAPRLTGDDPECSSDGNYCLNAPDAGDLVASNYSSWNSSVEQIYSTSKFLDEVPAFYLADITNKKRRPSGIESGLDLHANTEYLLSILYKYPIAKSSGQGRKIWVQMGSEVHREIKVGSTMDKLEVPFSLPPLDFSAGAISITTAVDAKSGGKSEVAFTADIPFRTKAWRSNLLLFGALFLISFLDSFHKVDWNFRDGDAWVSTFFEFLKFGVVVWAVFKYRGKLKLPGL